MVEVPVKHHPRTRGESKYGLWRIPKVLLDLTTLVILADFFVTPIYGWLGIGFVGLGLLLMTISTGLWWQGIHPELAGALTTLGPTLCGLGLVEITLGIIAEVLIRMHFELQQKEPLPHCPNSEPRTLQITERLTVCGIVGWFNPSGIADNFVQVLKFVLD